MKVDERMSGAEVAIRRGERLRVALDENPSTGHRWRLVRAGEPALVLREDRYVPPADPRPGAPGRRVLAFEALASGRAELLLECARAWDLARPSRRFGIAVRVTPTGRRPSTASGRRRCPAPRPRPRRPPG